MKKIINSLFLSMALFVWCPGATAQVEVQIEDIYIECSESFSVDVLVNNFTDVLGFQFTISFDADALDFQGYANMIGQGILIINDSDADNGILGVSWFNGVEITLPDGSAIMSIDFMSTGVCDGPTAIEITGSPIPIEISNINGPLPYTLEMGIVGFNSCDVIVSAGDDQLACFPGGDVVLDASISGTATSFLWSPPDGLSDPEELNPTADVSGPMTYTLSVQSVSDNLVYNADFQQGNTGFTSDYDFDDILGLINNGTYIVIESPALISSTFPPCVDHTDGMGLAMVVNGDGIPGEEVWCQTISIDPGTDYLLEMWVSTVIPIAPAQLQFYVNGQAVGGIHSPTAVSCEWVHFTEMWNSGAANTAEFCIVNQNTAALGNDFALDDIGFYQICVESDEVSVDVENEIIVEIDTSLCGGQLFQVGSNVYNTTGNYVDILTSSNGCDSTVMLDLTIVDVEAVIGNVAGLNCILDLVTIDGSSSTSGDHISYQWSSPDGNIVSGQGSNSIEVDEAGIYSLIVTYDDGEIECISQEALVVVAIDTVTPTAVFADIPQIDCGQPIVQITGQPSSDLFDASWSTTDGHIVSGQDSFTLTVDEPGTYIISVSNPQNGCDNSYSFTVEADLSFPLARISGDTILGCNMTELILDASGSSMDSNYIYQWYTTDGHISTDTVTFQVTIDQDGSYFFVVTDTASNCADTASIDIMSDFQVAQIFLNAPDVLNCLHPQLTMEAGTSMDSSLITIVWTTMDGHIVSGADGLHPVVDEPGLYTITVTRNSNQCVNQASINVLSDIDFPLAVAGLEDTLTCTQFELALDGSGSDTGPDIHYAWSSQDGNIVSGTNSLQPVIDQAGLYILTVIDSSNFCSSMDSVEIIADENIPTVSVQVEGMLNCLTDTLVLSSVGSDTGPDFTYEWSSMDGNIVSVTDADSILVDQTGTYVLRITDNQSMCASQSSALVMENRIIPEAEAGDTAYIDCQNPETALNGSIATASGSALVQWVTIDGNILDGDTTLQPVVNQAGTYYLILVDSVNGCPDVDSVSVIARDIIPVVNVTVAHDIDCSFLTTYISSGGSDSGPDFIYNWTTADGNILSPPDSDSILVDQGGTYRLDIENRLTGCTNSSEISVFDGRQLPFTNAGPDQEIDCLQPFVFLDGSASVQGPEFVTSWTTLDGTQIGSDSLIIEISTAGLYILHIRDTTNSCHSTDTVLVTGDTIHPDIQIALPGIIDCSRPEIAIDATASSQGPSIVAQWSSTDGHIVSGAQSLVATVDQAGQYTLLLRNEDNNCESRATIPVISDTLAPQISLQETDTLSCLQASILLSANILPDQGNYTILWTSPDGNIQGPVDQPDVMIDQAGSYTISVTDHENGCSGTGLVTVFNDANTPLAEAGPDRLLPCTGEEVLLDGTGSSTGHSIVYSWTAMTGVINGQADQLTALTNAAGIYILRVENQQNGCIAEDSVRTISIPILSANLAVTDPACNESSGSVSVSSIVGGSKPFLFALDDPSLTQNDGFFPSVSTGTHTIFISDSVGCEWQEAVMITSDTGFFLSLPNQILLQEGQTVTLPTMTDLSPDEIMDISWSPVTGLNCDDCLQPRHTASDNITLTIFVTDSSLCTKSASVNILVEKFGQVYIPSAFSPNGDGINDVFQLYGSTENILVEECKIFNRWGGQVFDRSMLGISDPLLSWDGTFDGKALQPGMYVYYIVVSRFAGERKSFQGEIYLIR